jgi:hypothetical protein
VEESFWCIAINDIRIVNTAFLEIWCGIPLYVDTLGDHIYYWVDNGKPRSVEFPDWFHTQATVLQS